MGITEFDRTGRHSRANEAAGRQLTGGLRTDLIISVALALAAVAFSSQIERERAT